MEEKPKPKEEEKRKSKVGFFGISTDRGKDEEKEALLPKKEEPKPAQEAVAVDKRYSTAWETRLAERPSTVACYACSNSKLERNFSNF